MQDIRKAFDSEKNPEVYISGYFFFFTGGWIYGHNPAEH